MCIRDSPQVDYEKCVKCATCMKFCPTDVIVVDKEAQDCVQFDFRYCKGCGICANECPKGCITMVAEEGK